MALFGFAMEHVSSSSASTPLGARLCLFTKRQRAVRVGLGDLCISLYCEAVRVARAQGASTVSGRAFHLLVGAFRVAIASAAGFCLLRDFAAARVLRNGLSFVHLVSGFGRDCWLCAFVFVGLGRLD